MEHSFLSPAINVLRWPYAQLCALWLRKYIVKQAGSYILCLSFNYMYKGKQTIVVYVHSTIWWDKWSSLWNASTMLQMIIVMTGWTAWFGLKLHRGTNSHHTMEEVAECCGYSLQLLHSTIRALSIDQVMILTPQVILHVNYQPPVTLKLLMHERDTIQWCTSIRIVTLIHS